MGAFCFRASPDIFFIAPPRTHALVFFVCAALFLPRGHGSTNSQDAVEHREYLPQAWQRAVTFRVLLQRRQKRPRSLPSASGTVRGDGGGGGGSGGVGALSLFTARVLSLSRGGGGGGGGSSTFKGAWQAAGATAATGRGGGGGGGGGVGGDESRSYCFVVTDDGIHDVPAAAALGEGEGWEGR